MGQIIQFKVRRLILDDIREMETFANYKGAKIPGFCLNVLRFKVREEKYLRSSRALHKTILTWTSRHFARIYADNPKIGEACLVEQMSFDPEKSRLVKVFPEGLRREPDCEYFSVVPVQAEATEDQKRPS